VCAVSVLIPYSAYAGVILKRKPESVGEKGGPTFLGSLLNVLVWRLVKQDPSQEIASSFRAQVPFTSRNDITFFVSLPFLVCADYRNLRRSVVAY
jgi:hypothetical protein